MNPALHAIICVLMVVSMIGLGYAMFRGIRSGWFDPNDLDD